MFLLKRKEKLMTRGRPVQPIDLSQDVKKQIRSIARSRSLSHGLVRHAQIILMAADAGIIPVGENVIAVGGQGRGADTAIVIKSANTTRFFDLDVQEIISKTITKRLARP